MKTSLSLVVSTVVIWFATPTLAHAADQDCHYDIDQNSIQVQWKAYKTNQKIAVDGGFTEVTIYGDLQNGFSTAALLGELEAEINLDTKDKIHTGNPARDQTLFDHFFSLFKAKHVIKGEIKKVMGNNFNGDFDLDLNLNGKLLAVPMKYTRDERGNFLAKGGIDLNDFGLKGPLAALSKACFNLHKGVDGVSKTWPLVEIKLLAKIAKKCSP